MKGKEVFESYSNLAYNLAGIAAFYFQNDILFCMALQARGAASFVYHFQKTKPIFLFDWWAMTFVVTILTGMVANTEWVWYSAIIYQIIYSYFILGKLNVFVEVGLAVVPCLIAIYLNRPITTFLIVTAIFLFALWVRSKDEDPKQLRFHDSVYHSLWHIFTAIGFYVAAYL